jgi:hypothetical protein
LSFFLVFFLIKRFSYAETWIDKFKYKMRFLPGGVVPIRFSTDGEASGGNVRCIGVDRTGGCVARQYALKK